MTATFGFTTKESPLTFSDNELRDLLSIHGVIHFSGNKLDDKELESVMGKFGSLQNFIEQNAPVKTTLIISDNETTTGENNLNIVNLHNADFLGNTRMAWHMDQSYLKKPYLPVRSLYCSIVREKNVTEFADIKYLTDRILEDWKEINTETECIFSRNNQTLYTTGPIFYYYKHIDKILLRYDNGMKFNNDAFTVKFKKYCLDIINGNEIPKFAVEWKPYDFVIFDNNQAPHRRSVMNGECRLKRLTSEFWLA